MCSQAYSILIIIGVNQPHIGHFCVQFLVETIFLNHIFIAFNTCVHGHVCFIHTTSPLVIKNSCTLWVTGNCWTHPQINTADWSMLSPVQVGSPLHHSYRPNLHHYLLLNLLIPIVWDGKAFDHSITSCDLMGAGILDSPGWPVVWPWNIYKLLFNYPVRLIYNEMISQCMNCV